MAEKARPSLGKVLEEIRVKKRFSKESLAREAGVSGAYIGQIERGRDDRTGKVRQPSPSILRFLAVALADHDRDETEEIYEQLMVAAGYMPQRTEQQKAEEKTVRQRVLEGDPTLRLQFHRVANYWDEFTDEEKVSVLSFLQFVEERHIKQREEAERKRAERGE